VQGQSGAPGAVRTLVALDSFEVHEDAAGDEVAVGVEIPAAVEGHPAGHRPGWQRRQEAFTGQVAHRDQVGGLVVVGQRQQVGRPGVSTQAHQPGSVDREGSVQLNQQRKRVAHPRPPLVWSVSEPGRIHRVNLAVAVDATQFEQQLLPGPHARHAPRP
jgi:hypothetical protein